LVSGFFYLRRKTMSSFALDQVMIAGPARFAVSICKVTPKHVQILSCVFFAAG